MAPVIAVVFVLVTRIFEVTAVVDMSIRNVPEVAKPMLLEPMRYRPVDVSEVKVYAGAAADPFTLRYLWEPVMVVVDKENN